MNEKNNKGLFVVIVFLIILVIGLASYIIYREISLTNEKQNKIEEVDNNEDKEPIPKNEISDVSQFPQKSDDSVIYSGTLESLLLNP